MAIHRIMCYGTLKRGGGNWERLLKNKATYICDAKIHGTMYSMGGFPAITLLGDNDIHGELFDVDDDVLEACDRLEGHPRWYLRTPVVTSQGAAEIYVMNELNGSTQRIIKSGVWPVSYTEEDEVEELTEDY